MIKKEQTIEELEHRLDSYGIGWLDFICKWEKEFMPE